MKLEDLKVGQYVRFKDKRGITYIRKIVEIPEDNRYASLYLDKEANYSRGLSPKNIIKEPSFNIIDILEEGDYVNGVEITKIYEKEDSFAGNCDYIFKEKTIEVCNDNYELIPFEALFTNNDIDTIVTKEQFEQMEYKVGK